MLEVSCYHSWKKQVGKRDAEQLLLERVSELEGTVSHTRQACVAVVRFTRVPFSSAPLFSSFLAHLPRELRKLRAEKLSKYKAPNEKKLACLEVVAGPAPGTVLFADPPNHALEVRHSGLPDARSIEIASVVAPPALTPALLTIVTSHLTRLNALFLSRTYSNF